MVTGISAKSPEPGCPGQRSELPSENALFSCLVDLGLTGAEMITSLPSSSHLHRLTLRLLRLIYTYLITYIFLPYLSHLISQ
jgi:hypothetical protein